MRVEDYKRWLQLDTAAEDREDRDLQKFLRDEFPMKSEDDRVSLEFVGYSVAGEEPPRLRTVLRLVVWDIDPDGSRSIRDVKEQEVALLALPTLPAFRDWDMPSDTETRILGDLRKALEKARKRIREIGDKVDYCMPHDFFSARMPR